MIERRENMKKYITAFLCLMLVGNLVGCGGTEYEDTNGENNYSLQTITNENIINLDTGSSGLSYSEEDLGGIISTKYSSKNFNGVEQLYTTNFIGSSDITVYIGTMNVKSGNFKLVAINEDKIIKEFPLDAFAETYFFEDISGTFSIHVAGESASFNFSIQIY